MKKLILVIGLLLFSSFTFSQSKVDSLIQEGIKCYDDGKYEKAIEIYNEALKLDPNEKDINYEIALTYVKLREYEKAIKHCDILLSGNLNKNIKIQTVIVKGSALDYLGKTKESIALFEDCLNNVGTHYLLYYNLGVDYQNIKDYKKAEESYINAIKLKNNHPGSHYMLGKLMDKKSQKSKSLFCMYYFLFLEPSTERARDAYNILLTTLNGDGKVTTDNENNKTKITININSTDNEFMAADFLLSIFQTKDITGENKDKSKEEIFIKNTKSFFEIATKKKDDKVKSFWFDFYVPFFKDLLESDNLDAFCYYISSSFSNKADKWLENNKSKVDKFIEWIENR